MSAVTATKGIEHYEEVQVSIPEGILKADESILFELPIKIGPLGQFMAAKVIVTQQRILRFEAEDRSSVQLAKSYDISSITKIEAQGLVGNGRLVVWLGEDKVDCIARYVVDDQPLYSAAARYVTRYLEDNKLRPIGPMELDKCPKCNRPLRANSKVCPACIDKRKLIKRLWEITLPHVWLVIEAMAIFFVLAGVNLMLPQIQRLLIDNVLRPQLLDLWLLLILVGGLALGRLLNVGLSIWRGRIMVKLSARLGRELRELVYTKIQALSLRFVDQRKTGDLMNRISGDTSHIQSFLQHQVPDVISQGIIFVGIGVILFITNWRLAFLVLIPAPLIVWLSRITWMKIRNMYRRQRRLGDKTNSLLQDILSGIRVVKAFGGEDREVIRFTAFSKEFADVTAYNEKTFNTLYPSLSFVMGLGNFLIFYFGGHMVYGEQLLVGELFLFSAYAGMIYQPLQYLTFVPRWFHQAMTSCERIFEVIDQQPDVEDKKDAAPLPNIKGRIHLNDVTFGYVKHEPVLQDIDLEIKEGEMIGLVGHSGAGKSTLINLVNRFYDVDEGAILIDGIDIRNIPQRDLRRQIGVVLQDTFLFSGTIWENIAYAKQDATAEDILRAAKIANAHDFIMKFTDGYDTRVGERGQRLSGGERQRIAIARAVLHDPKILILDEATSSVDSQTEKQIQDALRRLVANRTTIAIAHRLSTLRFANRLMVLDHGKQAELGTHDELMRLKGAYFKLVMAQKQMANMKAM